jgi:hypothetical protein
LLNNGQHDCPHGEDENIANLTCPGYYRCQNSGSCVHSAHLCDGVYQCPEKDDEMYCALTCPQQCVCEGLAFKCSAMVDPLQHIHLRYLDVSLARNVSLIDIHYMEYLVFLNLSATGLGDMNGAYNSSSLNSTDFKHLHLGGLRSLKTLDLSYNALNDLASLKLVDLPALAFLDLSHNPLMQSLSESFFVFLTNASLDIGLEILVLTNVGVRSLSSRVLSPLQNLKRLDLRGNPITHYEKDSLRELPELQTLLVDTPRLCCEYFHKTIPRCDAPRDELSSCNDLLSTDIFRIVLWLFSLLALSGNSGVLTYRLYAHRNTVNSSFRILTKNLCLADLLMCVYLLIVGVADAVYKDVYVEKEKEWTGSTACNVAGVLSLVSNEVSAFIICLITLDRGLSICFPFKKSCHLSCRAALLCCVAAWLCGLALAVTPLLAGLEFYDQNGVCVPLPITRAEFTGHSYAFALFICLNFTLFLLTGAGQVAIYRVVLQTRESAGTRHTDRDMVLARRLFLVVATNFLCWFPIGLLGLLATGGVPIPSVVNVWVVVFVLPFNSALNPFLYTLNDLLERRRKRRQDECIKRLLGRLQTEIPKWAASDVEQVVKFCLRSKLVDYKRVLKWLGNPADPGANSMTQETLPDLNN